MSGFEGVLLQEAISGPAVILLLALALGSVVQGVSTGENVIGLSRVLA